MKKLAYMSMFLAIALICGYIEFLFPITIGIPGIKLGLANLITVMVLYCVGAKEAVCVSFLRIILSGFLFGNAFSILYSLCGGILSFAMMYIAKKTNKLSCISVSITGGMFHNVGQCLIAMFVLNSYFVIYYIPVLLVCGFITGLLIGILSSEIMRRVKLPE